MADIFLSVSDSKHYKVYACIFGLSNAASIYSAYSDDVIPPIHVCLSAIHTFAITSAHDLRFYVVLKRTRTTADDITDVGYSIDHPRRRYFCTIDIDDATNRTFYDLKLS